MPLAPSASDPCPPRVHRRRESSTATPKASRALTAKVRCGAATGPRWPAWRTRRAPPTHPSASSAGGAGTRSRSVGGRRTAPRREAAANEVCRAQGGNVCRLACTNGLQLASSPSPRKSVDVAGRLLGRQPVIARRRLRTPSMPQSEGQPRQVACRVLW